MRPYYKISILSIILLVAFSTHAQFVNFGQSRSNIHWKQINTQDFQIIYPDFFEANAQKIANLYAQLYRNLNTLQLKPRKISVVIQADGGVSNGNVTSAPRKTELYTMPPQTPSDDWLSHLCVHEFRHVVQMDKVNQGITKGGSYLFGELFPIAVVGIYLPMWFMEGDAVCFETSIGQLGRGRSPEFLNEMKAQIIEKGIYSFSKAVLGSNKDYVPNRYTMGYFMTGNTRRHYGEHVWAKALEHVGRNPFNLNSFRKSLAISLLEKRDSLWQDSTFRSHFIHPEQIKKANSFRNAKQTLYHDNFSELQQIWSREVNQIYHTFDTLHTHNKTYTNYYAPTPIGNNSYIAYKKGLEESGSFVLLNHQKEKHITRTGTLYDYQFAYGDNHLVWSEYIPHTRWEHGGKMRLCSYDLTTGKYHRHLGKTNQVSPFKTDQGWGYVEIDSQNRSSIVICDSTLTQEIWRINGRENELFIHPSYAFGKVLTVVQTPEGNRLEEIDTHTKQRIPLTQNSYYELDFPIAADSAVVFRASYNGNNAFYHLQEGKISPLLFGRYGVQFPHYDPKNQQLSFSFYTSDGYKPGIYNQPTPSELPVKYASFPLADQLKKQEKWSLHTQNDTIYHSQKYSKFTHLFNLHSWGPLAIDLQKMGIAPGIMLYSQNKLSTLTFSAGYIFKPDYKTGCWLLNATYGGWWPIFSLNFESGKMENYNSVEAKHIPSDTIFPPFYIHNHSQHTEANLTIQFPFNLSRKQYNRSFTPFVRYKTEAFHHHKPQKVAVIYNDGNSIVASLANRDEFLIHQSSRYYQLLEYGFNFNNQTPMTNMDINPRWGQTLFFGYSRLLNHNLMLDDQWWYDCRFYLPGLSSHHSIYLYHGFQQMLGKNRSYSNNILYPRGITLPGYDISTLRCSYHFPLGHPDWSIGSTLYIKDLNASLFYDTGSSRSQFGTDRFSSYGVEVSCRSHVFQLTFPIHWGVRTGYETQTKNFFTEFLFSIGLSI